MRKLLTNKVPVLTAGCSLLCCLPSINVRADDASPQTSPPGTTHIPFDPNLFRADPTYADKPYDPSAQLGIYGDKYAVVSTRPMIELGRDLFTAGPFTPAPDVLGEKNLIFEHLYAYGDWRTAAGYNASNNKNTFGQASSRLDLDVDYQFTATERIHYFVRPFEGNGDLTRLDFLQPNKVDRGHFRFDGTPLGLFFEGDAAKIVQGLSDKDNHYDIPFAIGLMPMVIQNGEWLESAFTGVAVTAMSENSPTFRISNMDATFFAGFDQVNTAALNNRHDEDVFGVCTFIEANQGYWELDYGYTDPTRGLSDSGLGYHNLSAAFTRRYFDRVSNSMRVFYDVGQDPSGGKVKTANGYLLVMENSWVSPEEITLVPYANFFLGSGAPQSLARDAGTGGMLVNTGLTFEGDPLTGFPALDASGHDTYGGAIGCEYLFNLNQQLVIELSTVQILKNELAADTSTGEPAVDRQTATGAEYAVGVRYQIPLSRSWIFRTDGILAERLNESNLASVRFELRYKF